MSGLFFPPVALKIRQATQMFKPVSDFYCLFLFSSLPPLLCIMTGILRSPQLHNWNVGWQ